jgi:glucose/arabinose dehydrogenase
MNFLVSASLGALGLTLAWSSQVRAQSTVPAFQVRQGFHYSLVAQDFGSARFLELGPKGRLWVSQPGSGTIASLQRQSDGTYKKVGDFIKDKPTVHGMQWKAGWLWFTQSGTIWKARDTNNDGVADEEVKVLDNLPSGGGHWWRPILVTDTGFYTGIGDDGNINDHLDVTADKGEREKIWFFNLDGTGKTLWASGTRNTEKLRLRPGTSEVWGADHGSDNFGKSLGESRGNQPITDRIPPEEFNRYDKGGFYGHPFIMGNGMARLEYKDRPDILELAQKTTLPQWPLGAHWAVCGWTFATSNALGMKGDAFIACHGSWNSTPKVGYRVERVMFDPQTGTPMGSQMLLSMLSKDGEVLGRPVDVVEDSDGSLLVSDDASNRIYRVSKNVAMATNPMNGRTARSSTVGTPR